MDYHTLAALERQPDTGKVKTPVLFSPFVDQSAPGYVRIFSETL